MAQPKSTDLSIASAPRDRLKLPWHKIAQRRLKVRYTLILLSLSRLAERIAIAARKEASRVSGIFFGGPLIGSFPAPDPIFAAIERHRGARDFVNQIDEVNDMGRFEAAAAAEDDLIQQLITVKPTTLAGLAVFTTYLANYPPLKDDSVDAVQVVATVAESLRDLLAL